MATILTRAIARLMPPLTLVVSAAVLVKGYGGPGDGFSAGVIASIGVLLQYVVFGYRDAERLLGLRHAPLAALGGLLLALLLAFLPLLRGEAILTHFPPAGAAALRLGTLELTTAFAFDLAVFLLVFGFAVSAIAAIAHAAEQESP